MLRLLRRILGWDADSGPFDFDCLDQPARPPSSTASVLTQKQKPVPAQPGKKRPVAAQHGAEKPTGNPPATEGQHEKSASEILNNPSLSLNGPQDEGFDPYNTGAFNRSASWDKISKHRTNR